ncbi:MAG: hypothetical protein ALECFALPRED_011104 [Alectoria fallacina]|uniref:ABC transporter domain-containing protein n=1 Tax=Alectoria fallacina TaxID=1903189 RepID=A0A8H3F2P6_9LECA|nr:MAG: hypothetical protein ALECFALPRED_011104 [Alectoria fallacina]
MTKDLESGGDAAVSSHRATSQDVQENVNDLSFRAVDPVSVHVKGLNVDIDVSPSGLSAWTASLVRRKSTREPEFKAILRGVNSYMPSGSLTAIVGSSGSGKTSVLNTLSKRIAGGRLKTTGDVIYNGSSQISSIRSAYVMQQDILLSTLTVRETLRFAAELRLPPPTTAEERELVLEKVILELGLKECADTRIGNNIHKGCSGGEKRRTSLAVQMLSNPSVLFCDEVTTGLDAATAYQLVATLKALAVKGRTIICSIHQPRSEIWQLFDHVLLLAKGSPLYSGRSATCLAYFERHGYVLPSFVNPAEFLIDLAAIDSRSLEAEESSVTRVQGLIQAFRNSPENTELQVVEEKTSMGPTGSVVERPGQHHATLSHQIRVLTERTFIVTFRDPLGIIGSMLEAISMAVITGWIFLQLDGSLSGIRSREGALYTAASLQGYLILLFECYRLTVDIQIFDREYREGVVSVSSFLTSRRLARVFIEDVPVPLIFSVIFYFMAGFRPLASQFFVFFSVTLLSQYIAVNYATLCVAISRNFAGATLIANMGFTLQSLGCGYFVQANQIPIWVRWLKWAAYVFYSNSALAANEFVGHTSDPAGQLYDCPSAGGTANPACKEYTGQYIMRSLGFPSNWIVRPIIILLAFAIALYLGAGLILRYWKVGIEISRAQKNDTDYSSGKEKMTTRSPDDARTVDIRLDNYALDIQKRNTWLRKVPKISVLRPLNTTFEPGVLNVIMGPSGSGKTSLLDLMARRLHSSIAIRYETCGEMFFNGAIPSEKVIRSVCSYVCQDDDALLPYLTVGENLHFAAGLRLPAHLSNEEKQQRAESVLLKLGLRDCADNLVGSDVVKGISGGEKRRVTIAIQILTDPRILFLDEPTSGLDAFTAFSIIEVLRGLAEEGRTLVLTVHQSRSDLFKYFHNVLLLSRGGHSVYAGKGSSMLSHFGSLGFNCPTTTNPADFALDLITVNLQSAVKEATSREKVKSLILEWDHSKQTRIQTVSHMATPAELGSLARSMTPFRVAFPILLHRSFINFRRNPPSIFARTTQVLGYAICLTLFFAPLQSDYYSVQSRLGFIQEFAPLYFVGMLQNVAVYPDEKAVFYREHDDNAYSVEAFFLQYTLAEVPFEIFTSLLFAVLTVLAAGLDRTASLFFIVAFNAFAIVNCGESVGSSSIPSSIILASR